MNEKAIVFGKYKLFIDKKQTFTGNAYFYWHKSTAEYENLCQLINGELNQRYTQQNGKGKRYWHLSDDGSIFQLKSLSKRYEVSLGSSNFEKKLKQTENKEGDADLDNYIGVSKKIIPINRESVEGAKKIIDDFIKNESVKYPVLSFLSNSIIYANGLNQRNWNLNLDKNGGFIRFNVGHEFCIEIFKGYISILALKSYISENLWNRQLDIEYKGYNGKNKVISKDLSTTPDCLVKVPGSVACHIKHHDVLVAIPYLEEANRQFIAYAISNTVQLPSMNKAHSPGFISYLSNYCEHQIPNPEYTISEKEFHQIQELAEKEASKLNAAELLEKIKHEGHNPTVSRTSFVAYRFKRNPYIVEYTKKIAAGKCQDCGRQAPFLQKLTKEPFLETHHILPLADGGKDTIKNTIALCPNCHRKRHYG